MKDNSGRIIEYLRLSVTDRCNLRCRSCMPEEGGKSLSHGDILSYEELLRVAEAASRLGVRKIRVTGGEPLVREGIVPFIRRLAELPGGPEITLTTNGLLLADMAADLKQAGLRRVNVSLDTLRPDRYFDITRSEGLDRVLAGLEAAERAGLQPLKVDMVPVRGVNEDEIVDFARMTLRHPWEVRFIEYGSVAGDLDHRPEGRFPAPAILNELSRLGMLLPVPRRGSAGPARLYRYPGSPGWLGVIPAISDHFCRDCFRIRVSADGKIRPCLFSEQELDLRQALRQPSGDGELEALLRVAAGSNQEGHQRGEGGLMHTRRNMQGVGG